MAISAGPGGATAVEWAAYAMALGGLGETDEAAQALALAKDLLAEGGADDAAARSVVVGVRGVTSTETLTRSACQRARAGSLIAR